MQAVLSIVLALLAVGAASGQTVAQSQALATTNDVDVLNIALTVETFDSTYWSCFLSSTAPSNPNCVSINPAVPTYSVTDFANAGFNASVFAAVTLLAQEEIGHMNIIRAVLMSMSAIPVQNCTYNFSMVTSVASYLAIGQQIETVGTGAYVGAINGLTNQTLITAAATIATVEARHASYLSLLEGIQPFPSSAFNQAFNISYVVSQITPFFEFGNFSTCPVQPVPFTVRPFGLALGTNGGTNYTGPDGAPYAAGGYNYTLAEQSNDLATLNYALVLENLESNFYYLAAQNFTAAMFTAAGYNASIYNYFGVIQANEATHVNTLSTVIVARGGVPNVNCTYNFTTALSSIANYITYASILERTGVMAYDGAANHITDTNLLTVAAEIATVEARHSAFLNILLSGLANGEVYNYSNAFPSTTDTSQSPSEILAAVAATGLIVSCPGTQLAATSLPSPPTLSLPAAGSTSTTFSSSSSSSSSSTGYNNGAVAVSTSLSVLSVVVGTLMLLTL